MARHDLAYDPLEMCEDEEQGGGGGCSGPPPPLTR